MARSSLAARVSLPPQTLKTTSSSVLSGDGRHTVRIWSEDHAGNVEPAHVFEVAIDRTPPQANFTGPVPPINRGPSST